MPKTMNFYLSRVIGNRVYSDKNVVVGKLSDFVVDMGTVRPRIIAAKVKMGNRTKLLDFENFTISKNNGQYIITCTGVEEIDVSSYNTLLLSKNVLDKQIVDMDGRKLVRVNDLRLASLSNGTYAVAVDVGLDGIFRRLGIAKPVKKILKPLRLSVPNHLILWDEVATVDYSHAGIKLAKDYSKLSTLHPSDLADIIEDLNRDTQIAIFSSLDEEKAADVLEEMETDAQVNLLENIPVGKAADVLEKMPADEAADILDELDEEKAEELLNEMESEASQEIRDLMEYPENSVGSAMTTDYISFNENMTVESVITELRRLKPEAHSVYYLYIVDNNDRLTAVVSLRDLIVSDPDVPLHKIMDRDVLYVNDNDRIDSLADLISKYNLLAIPAVDDDMKMMGIVIIDDVIYSLLKSRKRRI